MFRKLIEVIQDMQKRRADYLVLSNMTGAQLHDLGINRCDIYRVVYTR
jgi:uncharacterized protein YjiS (DUF1127 family)